MSEVDERTYVSRCPICDSPLDSDERVGYRCPDCGWDETVGLDHRDVWFVPGDGRE